MRRRNNSIDDQMISAIDHKKRGNNRQAENVIKRILRKNPAHAAAHGLLGSVYLGQGKAEKATASLEEAARLEPESPRYRYELGAAFKAQRNYVRAIAEFEHALQIDDSIAEIHNNLGTTFYEIGERKKATECFERAIERHPGLFQPYLNLGNVYRDRDQLDKAIANYKRAIDLNPAASEAYNNLGHALLSLQKNREAVACFEKALEIDPDLYEANANLKYQQELTCDWREYEARNALLENQTRSALAAGRKPPVTPFQQISRSDDLALNLGVAQAWSAGCAVKMSNLALQRRATAKRRTESRLKIGYLSADLCNHPVGHIMAKVISGHDRERFHITAFSIGGNDGSADRERIISDCDAFVELETEPDFEAAQCIQDEDVDILVDLMGFTEGYRMEILAMKPAPIQVSYLGYPGTTGAAFMDYLIADRQVSPPDQASGYAERLVYLPDSYMFCPYADVSLDDTVSRSDVGLEEDKIVFCSFNQPYKIDPVLFGVWMNILSDIEDSVLWLAYRDPLARENLKRAAESHGVPANRIIFAENLPDVQDHLSRLQLADIALDTRMYNGHVTTIDCLYAGVPVITLRGSHFPSRVAASILHASGLSELVADDIETYRNLATGLARDPERRGMLCDKITNGRGSQPLYDTKGHIANLEACYEAIWQRFDSGQPPETIQVR